MPVFSRKIIGLDIGHSSVRVMEIKKSSKGSVINKIGVVSLPHGVFKNGIIMDGEVITKAIKVAIKKAGITNQNVVFSIDSQQVIIRQVKFPVMKEKELQQVLKYEAGQYLPMPQSEAIVDFQITGETVENGIPLLEVMLVATPRKIVEDYVKVVIDAGLKPLALEIEPLAISRILRQVGSNLEQENLFLIEVNAENTQIIAFHKGYIELNRIVPIGADDFIQTVSKGINISLESAEKIIKEKGITMEDLEIPLIENNVEYQVAATEEESSRPIKKSINLLRETLPLIIDILKEIRRTQEFYLLKHREETIDRILLVGGGALIKGLPELLEESLGTKVEIFNPLEHISFNAQTTEFALNATRLTQVIGLALREVSWHV